MNFEQFLNEEIIKRTRINYATPDNSQLNIIRQELDRNALKIAINNDFISSSEDNNKLIDLEYYIDGIGTIGDDVVIRGACIVETTEDGGYIYYKPVGFEYNMDKNELVAMDDSTNVSEENWKNVQSLLLRSFKKI